MLLCCIYAFLCIYVTHSKNLHTKIEFDLGRLSSPCIRNNLPQVHTSPFCRMLLCKFHVAKVLKPCLSADRWNLNPGNDATTSSTDSSSGLLVTLWCTVWRGLQEARPNAHAHFSSTQTWGRSVQICSRSPWVLRWRAAAAFGTLTGNQGHVFQLQLKYLGNLNLHVVVQPTDLLMTFLRSPLRTNS